MALSDIIRVNISIESAAVAAAGFGVPGVFGIHTRFGERFRSYDGDILASMAEDGFLTSDAEYIATQSILAGEVVPETVMIGRLTALVAQQQDITFAAAADGTYTYTINGTAHNFAASGSTVALIIAGLVSAINGGAQSSKVTASSQSGNTVLRVLSDISGTAFTHAATSTGSAMTDTDTTANHGVQEDLSEIRAAGGAWYGTMTTSRVPEQIKQAAIWSQSNTTPATIYMAQSDDATSASAAVNTSGTDIANILATAGYSRTALWWHALNAEYLDGGIEGRELPVDPGSDNWALKNVVGVTPSVLSTTYKTNLVNKNANYYYALTSQNSITWPGKMASGDWIDTIRFVDFLTARMSEGVANVMLTRERVNFDEPGLQLIAAQPRGVLQAAKDAGKITSFTVTVPDISAYSSANRAARVLDPPITFRAQLSGAFNEAEISGSVVE